MERINKFKRDDNYRLEKTILDLLRQLGNRINNFQHESEVSKDFIGIIKKAPAQSQGP